VGQSRYTVGDDGLEVRDAWHGAFVPSGSALATGDLFQGHRVRGPALDLFQDGGAKGDGLGGTITGFVVTDADVASLRGQK
jgi:hypothetical protein